MAARRELTFTHLEQVMPDVERLLAGHTTVGHWSLGQICNHLALTIRFTMQGYPTRAPWLIRQTLGRLAGARMFKTGRMPEGIKVPEVYLPKPGLDDQAESENLRAMINRFAAFSGLFHDHPFLGHLSPDQWRRLHKIHCAHHLSFALPS